MKKIPTMFERDWNGDRSRVVDKPHPDCDWVFAGEGWATQKLDGTCCLIDHGIFYKRREVKKGEVPPEDFQLIGFDEETGKSVGWVPVRPSDPSNKYHQEAFDALKAEDANTGTYELIGPKIQGNPERSERHVLIAHSSLGLPASEQPPRDFVGIRLWMADRDIEGIVFHHPDGRMAKIKLRDFGIKRRPHA
jgi:hypothetical protein